MEGGDEQAATRDEQAATRVEASKGRRQRAMRVQARTKQEAAHWTGQHIELESDKQEMARRSPLLDLLQRHKVRLGGRQQLRQRLRALHRAAQSNHKDKQ